MDVADPVLYEEQGFHSLFRELRASDPVHRCEQSQYGPYWAITRYADIVAVDLNHRVFSSEAGGISIFDLRVHRDRSFINLDPPEHKAHRAAVTPVFSTENLAQMRLEVQERVGRILDRVPLNEPFDWVTRVANELPLQMLSTLFGIPEEDRYHMLYWTDVQVALIGGQDPGIEERKKHPSFSVYFLDLLRRRASEKERTPDLVSHLIHGEQEISDEMVPESSAAAHGRRERHNPDQHRGWTRGGDRARSLCRPAREQGIGSDRRQRNDSLCHPGGASAKNGNLRFRVGRQEDS